MGTSTATTQLNSNINVTPLADVMLVLLIIFMVITPLLQKGVDVKLPEAEFSRDHPDSEDVVNVAIRLDNAIYLNLAPIAGSGARHQAFGSIRRKGGEDPLPQSRRGLGVPRRHTGNGALPRRRR